MAEASSFVQKSMPLWAQLIRSPQATADAAHAERFINGSLRIECHDNPDRWGFEFVGTGGHTEHFTAAELKRQTWWYWLPEETALMIEANLFNLRPPERPVRYVARADGRAGGRLIAGTRLSDFFEGDAGRDAAYDERERLRAEYPDAAVFEACSIADAERLLSAADTSAEGVALQHERMAAARAVRFGALGQEVTHG